MAIVILRIDLGKNLCSVVGLDENGAVVLRRSMRRNSVFDFTAKLPTCVMRWKPAAARTISASCWRRKGTT